MTDTSNGPLAGTVGPAPTRYVRDGKLALPARLIDNIRVESTGPALHVTAVGGTRCGKRRPVAGTSPAFGQRGTTSLCRACARVVSPTLSARWDALAAVFVAVNLADPTGIETAQRTAPIAASALRKLDPDLAAEGWPREHHTDIDALVRWAAARLTELTERCTTVLASESVEKLIDAAALSYLRASRANVSLLDGLDPQAFKYRYNDGVETICWSWEHAVTDGRPRDAVFVRGLETRVHLEQIGQLANVEVLSPRPGEAAQSLAARSWEAHIRPQIAELVERLDRAYETLRSMSAEPTRVLHITRPRELADSSLSARLVAWPIRRGPRGRTEWVLPPVVAAATLAHKALGAVYVGSLPADELTDVAWKLFHDDPDGFLPHAADMASLLANQAG